MRSTPPHRDRPALRHALCVLALAVSFAGPARAADSDEWVPSSIQTGSAVATPGSRGVGATGPKLYVRTKSVYEMRWESVVRQKVEIGCAAAALATILTSFFGIPTEEQPLVDALIKEAEGDPRDYRAYGFNMRHLRNVASSGGLIGRAFRVKIEDLDKLKIPAITRVTIKGYDHFVVLRGAQDGRVFVADPAFGNGSYRLKSFEKIWSGVVMAFLRRSGTIPDDHGLVVTSRDRNYDDPTELNRLAPVSPDLGRLTATVTRFGITPLPPVVGLESVLPSAVSSSVEF